MKIKFLLPFLLFFSCISGQAQVSVTVQSGLGQTFVQEEVGSRKIPDYIFYENTGYLSSYRSGSSELYAIYISHPIAEKWNVQIGMEAMQTRLIAYHISYSNSNELNNKFRSNDVRGIEVGTTSFPINLIFEEFLWQDKLYTSLKAGFSLTYPFRSRIFDNSMYPQISYGAHNHDSTMFDFAYTRDDLGRHDEVIFLNTGVTLGWKFNDWLRLEGGMHYRHGFVQILSVETTLFTDVEVPYPDNNRDYAIEYYGRETYNNHSPNSRHAFTTNGSAFFGTLSLTYTFAKKEKDK